MITRVRCKRCLEYVEPGRIVRDFPGPFTVVCDKCVGEFMDMYIARLAARDPHSKAAQCHRESAARIQRKSIGR